MVLILERLPLLEEGIPDRHMSAFVLWVTGFEPFLYEGVRKPSFSDPHESVTAQILLDEAITPVVKYRALTCEAGYSPEAAALAIATFHERSPMENP